MDWSWLDPRISIQAGVLMAMAPAEGGEQACCLLDTSICSCMVGKVRIAAITAAEFAYGVVASTQEADRNRAAFDRFLRAVPIAPFDPAAARVYGLVQLASRERRRDALDQLIVAYALALTPNLRTENWVG